MKAWRAKFADAEQANTRAGKANAARIAGEIHAKKEKQQEIRDLKKYFKNPQVTVGMVDQGYDIEIILGTADANQ